MAPAAAAPSRTKRSDAPSRANGSTARANGSTSRANGSTSRANGSAAASRTNGSATTTRAKGSAAPTRAQRNQRALANARTTQRAGAARATQRASAAPATRTAPARRKSGAAAPPKKSAARAASPVARVLNSRGMPLVDRVLRGPVWVVMLGVLLAGIVFLNVSVLELNRGIARTDAKSAALERTNSGLRERVAKLDSGERIQELAAARGFVMPQPGEVTFVRPRRSDAKLAAQRITTPNDAMTSDPTATTQTGYTTPVEPAGGATTGTAATTGTTGTTGTTPPTATTTPTGTTPTTTAPASAAPTAATTTQVP
jgi:cell division protein FtsL